MSSVMTPEVVAHLRTWEGRSENLEETLTPAPLRAMAATLDREDPEPREGDVVPALWHWAYFLPRARQGELGSDGHPRVGGFLPPVPLPRRMWAGGRLTWYEALRVGTTIRRTSTVVSVTHKSGRSGDLVFVVVRHDWREGGKVVLVEEQDLVYRAPAQAGAPPVPGVRPQSDPHFAREITPNPALLFRYSAITFNSHRIHYDRSYAIEAEGYRGLVVHGPLQATLLADLARRAAPDRPVAQFSFRAVRPLSDLGPCRVCGQAIQDSHVLKLWVQGPDQCLTMEADLRFR